MMRHAKLQDFEDCWHTNMGAWFPGEKTMLRGKNIFTQLNHESWMKVYLLGITGTLYEDKQIALFEGIWTICTSYPDPRLWNNRIAALAGTARSTATLGTSAAIAASEAIIYGHQPLHAALVFLLQTQQQVNNGATLTSLLEKNLSSNHSDNSSRPGSGKNRQVARIPGYGRPISSTDERIAPLQALAKELGLHDTPLVQLAFAIEQALQDLGSELRMNAAALMAALAGDQGLTPQQFYYFVILCFSAGIVPCYIDTAEKMEGAFFPLRCNRIHYQGKARRKWSSASES